MGQTCSCVQAIEVTAPPPLTDHEPTEPAPSCPDPLVYDLVRRNNPFPRGQHYLLFRKNKQPLDIAEDPSPPQATRLLVRENNGATQIYALRHPDVERPEQRPAVVKEPDKKEEPDLTIDPYVPTHMTVKPTRTVKDWVCVSQELNVYICDTGLTHAECDTLVQTTEQVCKGHYAAYTYAKQTLGCREYPVLAHACWETVHRVAHAIWEAFPASQKLQLDDREPHIVKYDVTKKERQKLDMHTDKSEWTFLVALSDGCGLDYEGGGTYFEALDATIHVQRGHALIFPGKLRHCGQRITKGLRFLLVGFLVDKTAQAAPTGKFFKDHIMNLEDASLGDEDA